MRGASHTGQTIARLLHGVEVIRVTAVEKKWGLDFELPTTKNLETGISLM